MPKRMARVGISLLEGERTYLYKKVGDIVRLTILVLSGAKKILTIVHSIDYLTHNDSLV